MNTKYFTIIAFMLFVSGVFSTHAQNRLDFLLNTLKDGGKSDYVMILLIVVIGGMLRRIHFKRIRAVLMPDLMALRLMCK